MPAVNDDLEGLHKPIDDTSVGTSLDAVETSTVKPSKSKVPISTHDVQHMAHAKAIFDRYDSDKNGKISIAEFQSCMRYFGLYFSYQQTIAMMEGFLQDNGRSIAQEQEIDESTFFFLLVQHEKYMPFDELNPGWFYGSPAEVVDRLMQLAYPIVLVIKIVVFKIRISTYHA
jgi:hypothetical protein